MYFLRNKVLRWTSAIVCFKNSREYRVLARIPCPLDIFHHSKITKKNVRNFKNDASNKAKTK